jgi:hypothetical protein
MIQPITPQEVEQSPEKSFPDFVFEAFNDLIQKNYRHGRATFTYDDAVRAVVKFSQGATNRAYAFEKGYLDVESAYRKQGWKVVTDQPGYNESGAGTFTFTK